MKVRITPTIMDEIQYTIADSLERLEDNRITDPTDHTYIKIGQAAGDKNSCTFEADEADIKELRERALYNVDSTGVVWENLSDAYDKYERAYWLSRLRAYRALLKQLEAA